MTENTFSKHNIETIILCSLTVGDKYGYEIASEINAATKTEIKQPTLYNYLKKLETNGLIESYWGDESNGGRRKYFKITAKGAENLKNFDAAAVTNEFTTQDFAKEQFDGENKTESMNENLYKSKQNRKSTLPA